MYENIFKDLGVEIKLKTPDDFLKIKETLTRIGISSKKEQKLYQSCHILHKRGRYAIFHFKEMFSLDGKETDISDEDLGRRNTIVNLLSEWNLVDIVDEDKVENPVSQIKTIKIIPYSDKKNWILSAKYTIGKK
jgi:hypothetical protein